MAAVAGRFLLGCLESPGCCSTATSWCSTSSSASFEAHRWGHQPAMLPAAGPAPQANHSSAAYAPVWNPEGHRGQHRRRPDRLVAAARPVRLRGPQRRRAGHAALSAVEPARRAVPPRPRPRSEDQPHLALEGRLPGLLAAAVRPARTGLTSHPLPATGKEAVPAQSEPVPPRRGNEPALGLAVTRRADDDCYAGFSASDTRVRSINGTMPFRV